MDYGQSMSDLGKEQDEKFFVPICAKCGTENKLTNKFCPGCGINFND